METVNHKQKIIKLMRSWIERHMAVTLLIIVAIPHAFVFAAGMLCRVWPGLLRGTLAYLIVYVLLLCGGLLLWAGIFIKKRRTDSGGME